MPTLWETSDSKRMIDGDIVSFFYQKEAGNYSLKLT
jgi:hypothetical protein